jgi:hypothetical protein
MTALTVVLGLLFDRPLAADVPTTDGTLFSDGLFALQIFRQPAPWSGTSAKAKNCQAARFKMNFPNQQSTKFRVRQFKIQIERLPPICVLKVFYGIFNLFI